jgi:hypothetical protein
LKLQKLTNPKLKLNSDYTIKFVAINSSKQDLTWIYLDKKNTDMWALLWIKNDIEYGWVRKKLI